MPTRLQLLPLVLLAGSCLVQAQEPPPPAAPQGVEVLARGPIHEAFASLTSEPAPSKPVPRKPPTPIEELPPEEKPDGDVLWIGGYWAWDDDRNDFLWVSGTWRKAPPGKQWVAGYWREEGEQWQWVAGFWAKETKEADQKVTYLPAPPKAPEVAQPGRPPAEDSFYVPGSWMWTGDRYAWRAGYWARVQPGYVWVSDHYRWSPSGYIFVPGYWDLALKNRGILYAPVAIQPSVVTVGFTYTPAYAVRDTVVVDALFVRPAHCHYYFGDYYGPTYASLGYESCFVYSRRRYDSIVVYECYERRREPAWVSLQINLFNDRCAGRAPRPPRTLVQQNTVINNTVINNNTTVVRNHTTVVNNITMIAPSSQVAQNKNVKLVKLDDSSRQQARQQAVAVGQVGKQRSSSEMALPAGAPRQPRVASLAVPKVQPVSAGQPNRGAIPPARSSAPTGATLGTPRTPTTAAAGVARTTPGVATRPAAGSAVQPAARTPLTPQANPVGMRPATATLDRPGQTTSVPGRAAAPQTTPLYRPAGSAPVPTIAQPGRQVQPTRTVRPQPAAARPSRPAKANEKRSETR